MLRTIPSIILVLILLHLSVCRAELLAPEKQEVIELMQSAINIQVGIRGIQSAMDAATTEEQWPDLYDALKLLITALTQQGRMFPLILNTFPDNHFDQGIDAYRARTRQDKLNEAWSLLDKSGPNDDTAVLYKLQLAIGYLQSAAIYEPANTNYQTALATLINTTLPSAITLAQIDRTLLYNQPFPPWHPMIIGPHGDYERAQWRLYRSIFYEQTMWSRVREALQGQTLVSSREMSRVPLTKGTLLTEDILRSMVRLTNTLMPEGDIADPFMRMMNIMNILMVSVPGGLLDAQENLRLYGANPSIQLALNVHARAWWRLDQAFWEFMVFPAGFQPGCPQ